MTEDDVLELYERSVEGALPVRVRVTGGDRFVADERLAPGGSSAARARGCRCSSRLAATPCWAEDTRGIRSDACHFREARFAP